MGVQINEPMILVRMLAVWPTIIADANAHGLQGRPISISIDDIQCMYMSS